MYMLTYVLHALSIVITCAYILHAFTDKTIWTPFSTHSTSRITRLNLILLVLKGFRVHSKNTMILLSNFKLHAFFMSLEGFPVLLFIKSIILLKKVFPLPLVKIVNRNVEALHPCLIPFVIFIVVCLVPFINILVRSSVYVCYKINDFGVDFVIHQRCDQCFFVY